jgi:hypothetical protein
MVKQFPFFLKTGMLAVLLFQLCCSVLSAATLNTEQKAPEIISALLDTMSFQIPVVPDVRCGEWTPALERELRKVLLQKQVDVREINFGLVKDNSEIILPTTESDSIMDGSRLLQMLRLPKADYLELNLEQSTETSERCGIISYARYETPVYRFILKQIALPEQKLSALREYTVKGEPEQENPGSLLSMKWYEPLLASAILGSLIYLLWTIK